MVPAAAGIDRLRARRRGRAAGARVSDRARTANIPHRAALRALAGAARRHVYFFPLCHRRRRPHHRAICRP